MKKQLAIPVRIFAIILFLFSATIAVAQEDEDGSRFLDKVRFGGGFGLNFGNGNFSATLAPSAVYDVNQYFSFGPSLIYSYQSNNFFKSSLYGGSLIGLINPIQQIQLSTELEQLRVNQKIQSAGGDIEDNFWNTAFFVGAGYRTNNFTAGIRYNLLFKDGESVYASAWAPFVRVFF